MSRVGKIPVAIPSGVKVAVSAGSVLVEGPKGKLQFKPASTVSVAVEQGKVIVAPIVKSADGAENDVQARADYGTTRAVINNMVLGVTKGWKKALELNGVGFGAKLQGQNLILSVGFSHDVNILIPKEVKCTITKNVIDLESADKQLVGALASNIRKVWPPEPYLGKGVKYVGENIRRKAGKTGKK